jgi:hypothetical protein
MTNDQPVIIRGDFVDLKFLKSRKVCQLVIEVPIEHGPLVVAAFGTPNPAITVPVALARLDPASVVEKPKGGKLAQRAGILSSGDALFHKFCEEVYGKTDAADVIRTFCGVKSRAELDHNERAASEFHTLERDYWKWRDGGGM